MYCAIATAVDVTGAQLIMTGTLDRLTLHVHAGSQILTLSGTAEQLRSFAAAVDSRVMDVELSAYPERFADMQRRYK